MSKVPDRIRVLVIVGPTASGKSALAVKLAKELHGEVISADSRQVYKGLDIGTGKVTKREMQGVRHHLLDVCSPKRTYSAADFVRDADRAIANITRRGKLPIVCGGTGFYIDALLRRVALGDAPRDPRLRTKLAQKTTAQLLAILQKRAPERAARMNESDRRNPVRLIRAIELAYAPHHARSSHTLIPHGRAELVYEAEWVGIEVETKELRAKIHARLLARMKRGMVAEARRLHAQGLSYKHMEELGLEYRALARHLQGTTNKSEMLAELEPQIWQYAKRQMTYWKRNKEIKWTTSPTLLMPDLKVYRTAADNADQ